jgi:PAS domain S-box-containing protein
VVPIAYEGRIIACLNIGSRAAYEIPPVARIALETIAIQIGVAIGRIRADEALAASEQRYRNVVEDQTEFISRFAPDGTHVFVNDAYCRNFGLQRDEILGHRFRPRVPPEDRPRLAAFFASLTPDHPVDTIEHRIVMPNGETRWHRWSDRALFDPSGAITEYQSVGRDITPQKLVEEELRARTGELDNRNRLITTVLDMVPFGIFMVEAPTGRPLLANREATRLLGRGVLPDATEENLGEVYEAYRAGTSERYPSDEMPVLRGMRGESSQVDDMVVVRPDGSRVQLEVIGMPVADGEGRVFASLVTFDDITDRKMDEQRVRETTSRFTLLTSITRHDVANQVSILRGYAKLAAKQAPTPELLALLDKIDGAGAAIARQIAFTKVFGEFQMHEPVWARVDEVVQRVLPGGISLVSSCSGVEIYADPMLERVFYNLLDNAVRHGERVTRIAVDCEERPDGLLLRIRDDGAGVPDGEKERIFEKGYGANTGFGLFLAREILAITGIGIAETGVFGEGARFELRVPPGMYRLPGRAVD